MSVARFWREIPHRYCLIGTKCECCGTYLFPPEQICPDCMRDSVGKLSEVELSGKGTVIAYSVVHAAPEGFELEVPYIMAIVELEEGARLTAEIVSCEACDIAIGTPVETVFRKIRQDGKDGIIYYGYKFRPVACQINNP